MRPHFQAGVKQFIALVLMLVAIAILSIGEVVLGLVVIGLSAVVSIGGLFYDAHRADLEAAGKKRE